MAAQLSLQNLDPTFHVEIDRQRRELHFMTSGLFDQENMDRFLREVAQKAGPLLAQKRPMRALGDLTGFVTQTRAIGEKMAETLSNAEDAGIERTAIIITSNILKMQYQRVSEGRNVAIFENRAQALQWLRA